MKKSKGNFISSLGEFGIIDFIKRNNTQFSKRHNVIIDVGDDCFCFGTDSSKKEKFLVTTDILIEDVHFKTCWASPKQIAQKAVEVNVSDVASMGDAKPLYMFISVGIPKKTTTDFVKELFKFNKIELVGLMMMAVKASDKSSLDDQFRKLRLLKEEVEKELNIKLPYLSMGMSDDYKEAIKEGATHIRLGRILFNE